MADAQPSSTGRTIDVVAVIPRADTMGDAPYDLAQEVMKTAFPGLTVADSPVGAAPVDDFCTGRWQGAALGTLASYEAIFFDRFDHPNGTA